MTEKKSIIIDNIDVSKCGYFNNTDECYCEECCSEFGCAICNDRPNCYFKQLEQKINECEKLQQECEKLEYHKNVILEHSRYYKNNCKRYKKEIGKLTEANETYKKMLDNPKVRVALIDIRTGERALWQKYKLRMEQAEQKLKRIRDICINGVYDEFHMPLDENSVILQIIDEENNEKNS